MDTSLLTTKLTTPSLRPPLIPRPRLVARLQKAADYALTLISAPAGFGKTTLLCEWMEHREPRYPIAWLSLDEADDDPVWFWRYFISAVRTWLNEAGAKALVQLVIGQPTAIRNVLTELLNDLARVTTDFFLVLDDYNFIQSPLIHENVTFALEHLPPKMHLVITTRIDPPLPLPRLLGRGLMQELRGDDLRFTREESAKMVQVLGGLPLGKNQLDALYAKTEGWAVGLKLAMLSLHDQQDLSRFLTDFTASPRYVMDYLIEEVLQHQPEVTRDFLLKTSILDWLSGPLCDALTGRKDGRETLERLEKENLFIIPLDRPYKWYRYEHIFAELLHHQLETTFSSEVIRDLHVRAGQWLEEHGLPDESVRHALEAREWDRSARLICKYGREKTRNGEFQTVYTWLRALPEEVRLASSEIRNLYFISASWVGKTKTAATLAASAEVEGRESIALGEQYLSNALVAWRELDYPLAGELAEKALSLLPASDVARRSGAKNMLGWLAGLDLSKAEPLFIQAYQGAQEVGDRFLAASAAGGLMKIALLRGQLRRVVELARQELTQAGELPTAVVPLINLSYIYYEWNDLEKAADLLQQAIELGRSIGPLQSRVQIHDMMARIELARGNEAGFLQAVRDADDAIESVSNNSDVQLDHAAYRVLFALWRDEPLEAETWSKLLSDGPSAISAILNFVYPCLLLRQGKRQEAVTRLEELYVEAAGSGATYLMVKYRLCQARANEDDVARLRLLTEALTTGKAEGCVRTFVDEGTELVSLLRKAIKQGIEPGYARGLLRLIETERRPTSKSAIAASSGLLSDRELEVLRLVSQGTSNPGISDRLNISLATVKTHVHHIIEKLEVRDRSQAVYRARELKLL